MKVNESFTHSCANLCRIFWSFPVLDDILWCLLFNETGHNLTKIS
jgi:hypothetical protein